MESFFSEMSGTNTFILITTVFVIFTFLFVVMRWLVLWYWRINEAVDSLQSIAFSLEKITDSLGKSNTDAVGNKEDLVDTLRQIKVENDLEK